MGYLSFLEGGGFSWVESPPTGEWGLFTCCESQLKSSELYCNWGILLWCPQLWHVLVRYQCLGMFGHNMQAYARFTVMLLRVLLLPQSLCENMPTRAEETMVTLGMSAHTDRLMKLMVENGVTNTAVMERLNGEPWVMSCLGFWVEGGVVFRSVNVQLLIYKLHQFTS